MAFFQPLYSGSSGNATLVSDRGTSVLVDMGKSCKATVSALYTAGISPRDLAGIFVTHEHSDHVAGLHTFLKRYPMPLFGSPLTLKKLLDDALIPPTADTVPVLPGERLHVGGWSVMPFRMPHDSVDCVGYRFSFFDGTHAAIATDLGTVTDAVKEAFFGCDLVAIESNYDEGMLQMGPYPLFLKRRISSLNGHLSNADCAHFAAALALEGTKRFLLMHLSAENNAPEIALTTCLGMMENCEVPNDCTVRIAPRNMVGDTFQVAP